MMTIRRCIVVGALAAACGGDPASYDGTAKLPARLADTGLYADFGRREIAADVLRYSPQYPLWTDGARKQRWIRLPPGTAIDAADADFWELPPGTRLWKEFAFDRPVETRFMHRREDGTWTYATYVWSVDGSDAVLAPEAGVPGAWREGALTFDIPGRADCLLCHDGGRGPVLGFSALQLSPDRDPLAPHAETPSADALDLLELQRRGLLRGANELAPRIQARTARERAALGYLHANCGSCHNSRGPLADLGLHLDWRFANAGEAPTSLPGAIQTACGQPSRFRSPGFDPAHSLRIAPGKPGHSTLIARAGSREPLTQMPPLGTRAVDAAALELLTAWIRDELVAATTDLNQPTWRKP